MQDQIHGTNTGGVGGGRGNVEGGDCGVCVPVCVCVFVVTSRDGEETSECA